MKETIVLMNGQYEAEFLRTCAKYGNQLINTRVMSSLELSDYSLSKNNVFESSKLITSEIETCAYYKILTDPRIKDKLKHFVSDSFLNAERINKGINNLRKLLTCDKDKEFETLSNILMNGTFKDKNIEISVLFKIYSEYKKQNNVLDTIDYIRLAIENVKEKIDEVVILNDLELSPLEIALAHATAKEVKVLSYKDFYKKSCGEPTLEITKARGKINEVLNVYKTIRDNNIPYDKCLFVTLDDSYDEIINNVSCKLGLSYYTGNGISNSITYPVKLYTLYNDWNEKYFNNIDSLKAMVYSKYFNKELLFEGIGEKEAENIIKECGSMKISDNESSNMTKLNNLFSSTRFENFKLYYNTLYGLEELNEDDYKAHLTHVVKELSLYTPEFIEKYYVPRSDYQDEEDDGLSAIEEAYTKIKVAGITSKVAMEEVINTIHNRKVSALHSEPGNIYVTDLIKAPTTLREYVFIIGLSSDIFPGKLKEDYVVLDSDYKLFDEDKYQNTSENKLINRTKNLIDFISLSKAMGSKINISYSNFDISEVKETNPASVLFEIYRMFNKDATVKEYEDSMKVIDSFFDSEFSKDDFIGKNHLEGNRLENVYRYEEEEKEKADTTNLFEYEYSPSAIEKLYNQCALKFFYERIYSLSEDDEDNPFEVITAIERGNLAHLNMETLKLNPGIKKETFVEECKDSFDSYLKARVAFDKKMAEKEKDLFIKMMEKEYDKMFDKNIFGTEVPVKKSYTHDEKTIKIGGRLDCVYEENGNYIIVDYKTGANIKHKDQDPVTCLQALLYAYMFEEEGKKVSRVEYHYLRYGKIIKCDYTDVIRTNTEAILNSCIDKIAQCNFSTDGVKTSKVCPNCKNAGICKLLK